jgi:hypothetical protein
MRRGCMFGCLGILGLCVLTSGLLYFVGLPRFRDAVGDGVADAMSTEVARQLAPQVGAPPNPGQYTITEEDLERSMAEEAEGQNVEDVDISITPNQIEIDLTSSGDQELSYAGQVAAENGRLVVTDFEASSDVMDFFFPADELAEGIEDGVNNYLATNGLRLNDVELGEGELTLDVEAA